MGTARFHSPPLPNYAYMDIRFYLRRAKRPGLPGVVYCQLTADSISAPAFSTGIKAWPPAPEGKKPSIARQWQNAPLQRLHGDTPEVRADNDILANLYAKIRELHAHLVNQHKPAGPVEVVAHLRSNGQATPTLAEAAKLFMRAAERQIRPADAPAWDKSGYSPDTVRKYHSRMGLLTEYLLSIGQPDLPLAQFTAKHADGLVQLLMTRAAAAGKVAGRNRGRCGADYTRKAVGLVSQVLDYAVNQEWIAANPLASWRGPRSAEKPLVYLLPEQVAQLQEYQFENEYLGRCADVFLLSCWTGLAWADLMKFDPATHTKNDWLEMHRHKTGVSFTLPLLPGATRLLNKYAASGLPRYENQPLNRALKEIVALMGWQLDLTMHAGRRTFGMFLLNEGIPLATVAAVLGHKDERTTAKHYSRFIEKRRVERDMAIMQKRLYNPDSQG